MRITGWLGGVRHHSRCENVFHLCVPKTASQWYRQVLADERTYRYSGLRHYQYQNDLPDKSDPRRLTERSFEKPFPPRTIVSPLYIDYENYRRIPKPETARGFFVMRDPRDITVSWYFSTKHSHPKMGQVDKNRERLNALSQAEGMAHAIETLTARGLYDALGSWSAVPPDDAEVIVLRYEDMIGPEQVALFERLFRHCDIRIPERTFRQLLADYSFKALSGGRKQGQEAVESHYRKGVAGDWKECFDDALVSRFKAATGDLVEALGYTW